MHLSPNRRKWNGRSAVVNDAFATLVIHSLLSCYVQRIRIYVCRRVLNPNGNLRLSLFPLSLSFISFLFISSSSLSSFFLSSVFFCLIVGDFLVVFQLSYISHAFHFVMRIQWPVDGADQLYTACVCLNFNTRTPFSDNLYFLRSLSLFLSLSQSVWGLSIACIICSTLDELFLKALWTGWNHAIHFMRRKQKTEMR